MNTAEDLRQNERPEMIRFEVSKSQLIGAPWTSPQGEKMQNILFADGWILVRPVSKLYETENGKMAFSMSVSKRDGSVNEITMKRSKRTEESDGNGKPVYELQKMVVPVADLVEIKKYATEKFKYKKAQEKQTNKSTQRIERKDALNASNISVTENKMSEQGIERFTVGENTGSWERFYIKDNVTGKDVSEVTSGETLRFSSIGYAKAYASRLNEVVQDGLLIRSFADKPPVMCKIAVQQNGLALAFIKNQTLDLCIDAVQQNPLAAVLVNDEFKEEVSKRLPELMFGKLLREEIPQDRVIEYMYALDDKSDYSIFVVDGKGGRHEVKACDIGVNVVKEADGGCIYNAKTAFGNISFSNRDIDEVQYKELVAAVYDTPQMRQQLRVDEKKDFIKGKIKSR